MKNEKIFEKIIQFVEVEQGIYILIGTCNYRR